MTSSSKLNKIVPLDYSELIKNIFGRTIFKKNIFIIYVKLREIHLLHHSVYENHWWENLIFLSIDLMIFIISGLPAGSFKRCGFQNSNFGATVTGYKLCHRLLPVLRHLAASASIIW